MQASSAQGVREERWREGSRDASDIEVEVSELSTQMGAAMCLKVPLAAPSDPTGPHPSGRGEQRYPEVTRKTKSG